MDSSTSMSRSDKREQFDELKAMIHNLAMEVGNSTAATSCAVAAMGEEVQKEVATMGEDVKKVAKKVDMIEEEVGATKNLLEKTNLRVENVQEAVQEHAKTMQQMEEEIAMMNAGEATERITR